MARVMLTSGGMAGAKRYQDLICWQLADELETLVFAVTEHGAASKDFKFRDQIRDSSSSAARNMAEGFARFLPADHANFLRIARSSLMETHNSARRGFKHGYFSAEDTDRMQRLCARAGKAATRLMLYLESQIPPTMRRKRRRRS
jgi:four helix bundle protein